LRFYSFEAIRFSFVAGREAAQPAARQGGFFRLRTMNPDK
jgi:hypothetical protein